MYAELKDMNSISVSIQKENLDLSTAQLQIKETVTNIPKLDTGTKFSGKKACII